MPDAPNLGPDLFQGLRPTIVTDEGEARGTFSKEAAAEAAMSDKVSAIDLPVGSSFENQFVSQYSCRVFPWALNYDSGGADYPELFADWAWLERFTARNDGEDAVGSLQERWRRIHGEAPLLPGEYARMLACRPEMQIAGDWMCVPAARNLHWRYAVLHSSFMMCKQKVAPGESMHQNLDRLMNSLQKIWNKISDNAVVIDKRKVPINGSLGLLFSDSTIDSVDKLVLRSYMEVTKTYRAAKRCAKRSGTYFSGSGVATGNASSLPYLQTGGTRPYSSACHGAGRTTPCWQSGIGHPATETRAWHSGDTAMHHPQSHPSSRTPTTCETKQELV